MFKQEISGSSVPLDLHQETRVEDRRHSAIQCYACGSSEVEAVCHHCGRFLCAKHVARPRFYEEPSWEFKGMVGSSQWPKSAHCEDDSHFVFAYRRILLAPALLGFAVVVCPFMRVVTNLINFVWRFFHQLVPYSVWVCWCVIAWNQGERRLILDVIFELLHPPIILFILTAATLAMAIMGYRLHVKKGIPNLENHPKHPPMSDIPQPPSRYSVETIETLNVEVILSSAKHKHIDIRSATGRIDIQVELDHRVQQCLEVYRERARRYNWKPQRAVGWNLGFIALDMPNNVSWLPRFSPQGRANNLIPLNRSHREIPEMVEEGQRQWVRLVEQDYLMKRESLHFGQASKRRAILRVIPVLQPMSAARTVVFLFSLPESLADGNWILRNLTLHLPPEAFEAGQVDFPVRETNGVPDQSNWRVSWSRWQLTNKLKALDYPHVTFTSPISRLRSPLKLEFELEGDRLISPLNVADHIWLPTGTAVEPQAILEQHKCTLCGVIKVDPLFFSYQSEHATSRSQRLPVAITPNLLRDLLDRLSEGDPDIIVHTVAQNTPLVTAQEGFNSIGWDIFGRYYAHIYPIDVHLFLSSRLPLDRNGQDNGELETTVSLTCRALVNNQTEYVQEQAEWLANRLIDVVKEAGNRTMGG